ncbi:hypothetical protein [Psychrobacter pygoscelis]|uniref:hypothetical protein n=1 Tax=Psychrobacter pygoscelis TaxID=2488563 RepID=UPI00103D975C|nr:hypothetical protein [Psychrobacter pygoscelis]
MRKTLPFKSLKSSRRAGQLLQRRSRSSSLAAILSTSLILSFSTVNLVGCDRIGSDPMKQTIPTDSEKWQDKLGDTFDQLSEEDRNLLSRYMLRMKLGKAYETGAVPSITIGKALEQQRKYEELHPDNPTGQDSPVLSQSASNSQPYSITLLPVQSSQDDSLNNVKLRFLLSNQGDVAIDSFKGSLLIQAEVFKEGKPVLIPLKTFEPPIAPNSATKFAIDSSIADVNIIKAIKDPQAVKVTITEGTFTLADGNKIEIKATTP